MLPLTVICPECKKIEVIHVYTDDLIKYNNGMKATEAFPYLNIDQHERLISGICKQCWDWLFSNKDVMKSNKDGG